MKLVTILATAIALFATPAFAQHHPGGGGPGGPHGGPGVHIGPGHFDIDVGGGGFHGRWLGFGRHFYDGTWYDYGVGPCWTLGPDGRYWWICD
jgi:hypothetical protein